MFNPWFLATTVALVAAAPALAQTAPAQPASTGRVVSRIDFTGAASDVERLRQLATIKVGQPLSAAAVRDTLAVFYQKGLWSAITADETAQPDGTVVVTFKFIPQLLLAEWRFQGNQNLNGNVLGRALDLTWGDPINPRAFEGYVSTIRDRYVREGFFNVKVKVDVAHVEENRGKLIVTIDEGKPLMLSAIKLLSLGPLSEREILGELGVKPGERLPRDAAFQGLDRLETLLSGKGFLNSRLSYYFVLPDGTRQTSYAAMAEAKTPSVELVLAVEEGQKALVTVDGDVILPVEELANAITVYDNRSYSPFELDFSANNMRELYVSRGYPEAKVTHAIARQPDDSYMITFTVNAGQRVTIKAIEFEGHKAYMADQLRRVLQTQPSRAFLGGGAFVPDVWEADMANLVAWYETHGFLAAKVTAVDRLVDQDTGDMTLVVHLAEGPRTMIARLLFKGATPAQEAGLLQALPINPGEAYNPRRLGDYIASVEAFYARTGYPVAKVTGAFEPGATPAAGALVFNVVPGPRKRIGHVILRGNLKTQDWVVRRQLTVEQGDTYNSEQMLRTQQQIYQLGFFDRVNIGPLRPITSDPNDPVDLVVDLHERETGSVAVGGGFGDLQGPQASAEYLQTNLLGTGRPVRLEGLVSQRRNSALFTLRDPFLFGDANIGELGASYLHDQPVELIDVTTYGPTFGLSRQITDHLLSSIRYSWSRTTYDYPVGLEPARTAGLVNRINSIITTGLTFDSRSDILNPRWGSRTEISVDFATPFLGGSLTYGRPRVNWAYFWPFPRQVTLALGAELGYIRTLEESAQLPLDLLFRAGGGNSIRGYTYNEVGVNGSPQGGQALLVTHAELRFPIHGDIGGVVFTDAGNVWGSTLDFNPTNVKLAAGLGLRYLTPLGPIRVDYAFRVFPQLDFGFGTPPLDLIGRHLYFGIGHAF
ncbi:MAG: outer membrane protein assembly factor BamA [Candidatus Sericytochromatia bacterium]